MSVYLCGGINGLSDSECRDWREHVKSLIRETIDPMRRDYRGIEAGNETSIVTGDLEDITACEAVLVNASRPSWGTAMEIVYAFQQGKRIVAFGVSGKVSPWLSYHCELFPSLDLAIEALK